MNIVKELRKKAGIQQKELAIEIGVSQPTVSDWESGKKDPTGERLKKLAEYFEVDELTILGVNVSSAKISGEKSDLELMKIPQIAMMAREMGEMTPEQRDQMLAIGRTLMKEFFGIEADK